MLAVLLVTGCDEPAPKKRAARRPKDSAAASEAAAEKNLLGAPDIFIASPHTIEGCVGLYTYDSLKTTFDNMDVDKGRKILATKTAEFAYLRFHGKDILLKYDKKESMIVDKTKQKEVYKGNGFVVVLITEVIQTKGEEMLSTGTLEITQGDKKIKIKIGGVSGC
ncbi:MAG: hypothetical protein JST68_28170 [Bacteroidetes bacterium]|nr:hypothetical protein [Bacteroidota bacterium]